MRARRPETAPPRLEGLTKELGSDVVLSEATALAADAVGLRPLGEVALRGRTGKLRLFGLQGAPQQTTPVK